MTTTAPRAFPASRAAVRREAVVAQTAFAVVALHLVDDNFLQPQPGTSAEDHLVSGVVPLVGLIAIATAYPGLRAGMRATLALMVGLFAVVGGAGEAGYYALKVGPSGDDYTGLLMLLAGIVLLGLGAFTLWRTRRTDDSLPRRYGRRTLTTVVAAVALVFVLLPLLSAYVYTHAARAVVPPPRLGAPHENVTLTTADGLRLKGWYVPSRNGAAVIAFPGRSGPQSPARMLVSHGYGVLLFDRRGEGESDGDPNALGWAGDKDLDAAISFLQDRADVEPGRIEGIGLSVGGEMLLDRAADSTALRAVRVRRSRDTVGPGGGTRLQPRGALFRGAVLGSDDGGRRALRERPPAAEPGGARRSDRTPCGVPHPRRPRTRRGELEPQVLRGCGEPKSLWTIPEAGHTGGIEARPAEYERRIIAFFDQTLMDRD